MRNIQCCTFQCTEIVSAEMRYFCKSRENMAKIVVAYVCDNFWLDFSASAKKEDFRTCQVQSRIIYFLEGVQQKYVSALFFGPYQFDRLDLAKRWAIIAHLDHIGGTHFQIFKTAFLVFKWQEFRIRDLIHRFMEVEYPTVFSELKITLKNTLFWSKHLFVSIIDIIQQCGKKLST